MAILYVTEFDNAGIFYGHPFPIAAYPNKAYQTVAIGASSADSNAFGSMTCLLRVHTDSVCCIDIGVSPTAVGSTGGSPTARMVAGQTEYYFVPRGLGWKIAVITSS